MNFIVFVCCWYVLVFGVYLLQVAWHCWRSGVSLPPQEPVMTLREGETVIGVVDQPGALRFYLGDMVDEKRYE